MTEKELKPIGLEVTEMSDTIKIFIDTREIKKNITIEIVGLKPIQKIGEEEK